MNDETPRGYVRFEPTAPRKVTIPHLPAPEEFPAHLHAEAPPHESPHLLRNFLYRTFMLPLVGMGFFVPVPELPALPPGQIVQIAPSDTRKAAESQSLDAQIRAHQSGLLGPIDPDLILRGGNLAKAIEAVAEVPEKVADKEDAIRSVLDAYATLETERGKTYEDVAEGLKKIREWQSLE